MLVKKLLGKEVISSNGNKLGKVADIDIDFISTKVKHLVVNVGINKKYKIKIDDVITVGDTVIIRLNMADLEQSSRKSK